MILVTQFVMMVASLAGLATIITASYFFYVCAEGLIGYSRWLRRVRIATRILFVCSAAASVLVVVTLTMELFGAFD